MSTRLPVTLIGGFLGSGKTSLLHHIITGHDGGHLAVLVESPGPLNLDAGAMRGLRGAMRRLQDVVLEVPARSGEETLTWLAATLAELAGQGRYERVLVEIAGTSNPAWLAEHFLPGGVLAPSAALEQIITVVDALDYFRAGLGPVAARAWWDFQNEQIAGATLVVLNKCDLLDERELPACVGLLRQTHPAAHWAETAYGELPREVWAAPASPREIEAALTRRLQLVPRDLPALSSALYRVYRPFHPARFWDWFNADHPGLLRLKGLVWLASRHLLVGGVSRTRWQNACGAAGVWWDALPREEWPQDEAALHRMQQTWREPYGDRRQELVLVGDPAFLAGAARTGLDGCLLNDAEFSQPVAAWSALPDPFPQWDVQE